MIFWLFNVDPLLTRRRKRAPIGWLNTRYLCLDCEPQVEDGVFEELREGDDACKPITCDRCGKVLDGRE